MHAALLLTHSWLRWVILAGGVYVVLHLCRICVSRRAWQGRDNYLVWAFGRAFLYQVLFGVLLYMMLGEPSARDLDRRLGQPVPWPLVHGVVMLAALGVFHGGKALVYRRVPLSHRASAFLALMVGTLAMIAVSIPWPFLTFGRPLFRLP
jgi:hypothetical protein